MAIQKYEEAVKKEPTCLQNYAACVIEMMPLLGSRKCMKEAADDWLQLLFGRI